MRADVEDRKGVLAVVEASRGENHGDEVDAGVVQERGGGGFSEELKARKLIFRTEVEKWVPRKYLDVYS